MKSVARILIFTFLVVLLFSIFKIYTVKKEPKGNKASIATNEPNLNNSGLLNSEDKSINLEAPLKGSFISSPLTIQGKAKGNWFFEGSFPVVLTDWDGKIIAEGKVTAEEDWMSENMVPFKGILSFVKPSYGERGSLILRKDNPSGLPQNDKAYEITVYFK